MERGGTVPPLRQRVAARGQQRGAKRWVMAGPEIADLRDKAPSVDHGLEDRNALEGMGATGLGKLRKDAGKLDGCKYVATDSKDRYG